MVTYNNTYALECPVCGRVRKAQSRLGSSILTKAVMCGNCVVLRTVDVLDGPDASTCQPPAKEMNDE